MFNQIHILTSGTWLRGSLMYLRIQLAILQILNTISGHCHNLKTIPWKWLWLCLSGSSGSWINGLSSWFSWTSSLLLLLSHMSKWWLERPLFLTFIEHNLIGKQLRSFNIWRENNLTLECSCWQLILRPRLKVTMNGKDSSRASRRSSNPKTWIWIPKFRNLSKVKSLTLSKAKKTSKTIITMVWS